MTRIGSLLIVAVSAIHCAWGVALMVSPLRITGISLILELCRGNNYLAGLIFILAGLLATISVWSNLRTQLRHLMMFLPQQFLLFVSMIGSIESIASGSFPNGEHISPLFVFVDQIYLIVLCFFHIFAIIIGYGFRRVIRFT